jgi:MFS family permease
VFTATFFVRFSFGITLAVFASYLTGHSTGLSFQEAGTVGVVSAMAPVGEFSTVLFSGAAADRWGRYPVLFGGMAGAAALFVVVAATRSVDALGAANFVFGIASGAILASSLAVVADRSQVEVRGTAMGRFDAVNLSGWVGGFAFGFWAQGAIPNDRLSLVFVAGAAALVAGIGLAALLLRRVPPRAAVPSFPWRSVLSDAFRGHVLVVTLPWLAIYALIGTALTFLHPAAASVGVSTDLLAAAIGAGGGLLVLTQPYFGGWADRVGRTTMMTVGAAGFVLVLVFASLVVAYGAAGPLLVGLGASVLPALAYGPAALAALADLATGLGRATTMAIYSLTISLGMIVGIAGAGLLVARFGNRGLYLFFGAIAVVLVVFTAARWSEARRATIPVR